MPLTFYRMRGQKKMRMIGKRTEEGEEKMIGWKGKEEKMIVKEEERERRDEKRRRGGREGNEMRKREIDQKKRV